MKRNRSLSAAPNPSASSEMLGIALGAVLGGVGGWFWQNQYLYAGSRGRVGRGGSRQSHHRRLLRRPRLRILACFRMRFRRRFGLFRWESDLTSIMTSIRSVHPEEYIATDPAPVDPLNKILPSIGQVHPAWRQRHAMMHGRYLSGLGGLAGAGPIAQKRRDGRFEVGGSCDFLTDGDEPDWSDPLLSENENEDDSVGSGIFDQAGGATVHTDMGIMADHPAMPGYIARNPPFYVNPEVQDVTADAQVLEVPGGGLNYLEHGGINSAPCVSPFARYEPYVSYPCQSQFHPRQTDKWQAGPPPGQEPPMPMNSPPISANPPPPGSTMPVEPHRPTPRSKKYPSALGPVPHPWRPPSSVEPGVPTVPGGAPPTSMSIHGYGAFGECPETESGPAYLPPDTHGVPGSPCRPCNPGKRRPYGTLVPFQRIVDPIDMAAPLDYGEPSPEPCDGYASPLALALPRALPLPPLQGFGHYGRRNGGIQTVSTVDPTGQSIPIGYGYYGQDDAGATSPPDPGATPTVPTQAAVPSGPGVGSYVMAGVVLGVAAYLVVGATSGKAKR